jgi:6-phosphogluconolactonase (cycloisomerase 2 family)
MNRTISDLTARALVLVPLTGILLSSCGGGSAGNNAVTSAKPVQYGIEGTGGGPPPGPVPVKTTNVVSCAPSSMTVDPTGRFAYVANEGCGNAPPGSVSMYTIDATSGALASIGPPVPTNDEGALSVAVSPSGRSLYVANWGEGDTAGSVSVFTVNGTTGALTFTANVRAPCDTVPPNPGSCAPWSVALDPSGKFAYVANEGGFAPTSVSMYAIDPTTGDLTFIGIVGVEARYRATAVAVDPLGRFAYVGSSTGLPNGVSVVATYTIDPTTGALTLVGGIAGGPWAAVHPSGKFVYVMSSSSTLTYTVNPTTGVLTSVGTTAGSLMAMDPSGQFAYMTNATNELSTYAINLTTGALTPQGTAMTGLIPGPIVIHPSGKFAYAVNRASNEVWAYRIDSVTGAWSLIASIPN